MNACQAYAPHSQHYPALGIGKKHTTPCASCKLFLMPPSRACTILRLIRTRRTAPMVSSLVPWKSKEVRVLQQMHTAVPVSARARAPGWYRSKHHTCTCSCNCCCTYCKDWLWHKHGRAVTWRIPLEIVHEVGNLAACMPRYHPRGGTLNQNH